MKSREVDIFKNMKTIDWLKAELLTGVADLYKDLAINDDNTKENLEDSISNIIFSSYILGKRLGLTYEGIDLALKENIRLNLIEEHKIEKWYGDLGQLLNFLGSREGQR